jgi:Tfp pilus assembly protein PilX
MVGRARRRLDREDGVVLVVIMGVLLVLGLISGAVLASAIAGKRNSSADRNGKQAYGTALAGLRSAIYWLNTSAPDDNKCPPLPGTTTQVTPLANNVCGPYESDNLSAVGGSVTTQPVTNGRFTYWITPVLDTSTNVDGSSSATNNDICTGAPPRVAPGRKLQVWDRCVTAIGQAYAKGSTTITATRRIQARVSASQVLFPIPGVWGTSCVTIGGNVGATDTSCNDAPSQLGSNTYIGAVGSNGSVVPSNSTVGINAGIPGWTDDPGLLTASPANLYLGCTTPDCTATAGYDFKIKSGFDCNPGACNATTPAPSGCSGNSPNGAVHYCTTSTPPLPYSNNKPILFGRYFPLPRVGETFVKPPPMKFTASPVGGLCSAANFDVAGCNDNVRIGTAVSTQSCGGATTFNATTRILIVGSGCTLSIPNGTYDFCGLTLNSGSRVLPSDTSAVVGSGNPPVLDPHEHAEVRVFIDSTARATAAPNSNPACTTGSGLTVDQNGTRPIWMSNAASNDSCAVGFAKDPWSSLAGAMFIYGAGDPINTETNYPPRVNSALGLPGQMFFHGLLEAPNSTLNVTGSNACLKGGLAAGALNVQGNANFTWDPNADTLIGSTLRTYYRTAWTNCNAKTNGWTGTPAYPPFPMDAC